MNQLWYLTPTMDKNLEVIDEWNDDEVKRLKLHLETVMAPHPSGEDIDEEARALKALANNTLITAITTPETRQPTADLLVSEFESAPEQGSIVRLYAYYSLIRKVRERNPEMEFPCNLLELVQRQARSHDETDIEFAAMTLLPDEAEIKEESASERIEKIEKKAREEYKSPIKELSEKKQREFQAFVSYTLGELSAFAAVCYVELDQHTGERQELETRLLKECDGNVEKLLQEIEKGTFETLEGVSAAVAQHDRDLLRKHVDSLVDLRYEFKKFRTSKGKDAARAQHDLLFFKLHEHNPIAFQNETIKNFKSLSGKDAARAHRDNYLFERSLGNVTKLHEDLMNDQFQTELGREAARKVVGLD